jgi:hypothetical protein
MYNGMKMKKSNIRRPLAMGKLKEINGKYKNICIEHNTEVPGSIPGHSLGFF